MKLPSRLTIQVTQEDINQGKQGDCKFCPVALAIQRCLKQLDPEGSYRPEVYVSHIAICSDEGFVSYDHKPRVNRFLFHFDTNKPVHPFTTILKKTL